MCFKKPKNLNININNKKVKKPNFNFVCSGSPAVSSHGTKQNFQHFSHYKIIEITKLKESNVKIGWIDKLFFLSISCFCTFNAFALICLFTKSLSTFSFKIIRIIRDTPHTYNRPINI